MPQSCACSRIVNAALDGEGQAELQLIDTAMAGRLAGSSNVGQSCPQSLFRLFAHFAFSSAADVQYSVSITIQCSILNTDLLILKILQLIFDTQRTTYKKSCMIAQHGSSSQEATSHRTLRLSAGGLQFPGPYNRCLCSHARTDNASWAKERNSESAKQYGYRQRVISHSVRHA